MSNDLQTALENLAAAQAAVLELLPNATAGNLTGNIAEGLTATALNAALTDANEEGCDLIAQDGKRIEVKSCTYRKKGDPYRTGAIRCMDKDTFDELVAVQFGEAHKVIRAVSIPHSVVKQFAGYRANGDGYLVISKKVLAAKGVKEITHLYQ